MKPDVKKAEIPVSSQTTLANFAKRLSVPRTGFRKYGMTPRQARIDLLSGLTVALALVPEAVAFAFVAGVHPLVGGLHRGVDHSGNRWPPIWPQRLLWG